ncbi:MAG: transcriptional regulator, AraC family-like protein [Ramlibacter sp.]|nr:transcriptional regulator, AraC family-like protein [Ramlibacter sp.]
MAQAPVHRCRLLGSPWPGVHATAISSARHYARHTHATFGLGVVDQGAQRSASGRGTVDAFAGDIVTTNPGEVHDGRPLGGPTRAWRTVYLEPELLASVTGDPRAVAITRPAFADRELAHATRHLLATMEAWQQGQGDALACEVALVAACGLLLERHSTLPPPRPAPAAPLAAVRERLADDLLAPPSLAELAALAGLSRFQLLRRFAAAYGLTPHAWLLQQRAERVRGLIARGTKLATAAAAAGFADQSHMTRIFTRQFGFTPGAWQRARAGPQ